MRQMVLVQVAALGATAAWLAGAARASAVPAAASARMVVRIRRIGPPPGARPGALLHLVQVACRLAPCGYLAHCCAEIENSLFMPSMGTDSF